MSIYCESKTTVTITVEDDADRVLFTFSSFGLKPRLVSRLEFDMLGFLCRAWIDMQKGEIRRAEENDSGAVLQFSLPCA